MTPLEFHAVFATVSHMSKKVTSTLHCIYQKNYDALAGTVVTLLQDAAESRNVIFKIYDPQTYNYAHVSPLKKGDMLYRITPNTPSRTLESLLLAPEVATFYTDGRNRVQRSLFGSALANAKANLHIIPTVFDFTRDRTKLQSYCDYLGGFPIIIKALGGSHGVGVVRVDSAESLFSIADILLETRREEIMMRKYIDYETHARLIVLGNAVVGSIEYKRVEGDFRSNVGNALSVQPRTFSPEVEKTAIASVRSLGHEFGGVDILIDADKKHYLAEVNFPCFFPRTQTATGIDIAGLMIDHLLQKAVSHN